MVLDIEKITLVNNWNYHISHVLKIMKNTNEGHTQDPKVLIRDIAYMEIYFSNEIIVGKEV